MILSGDAFEASFRFNIEEQSQIQFYSQNILLLQVLIIFFTTFLASYALILKQSIRSIIEYRAINHLQKNA